MNDWHAIYNESPSLRDEHMRNLDEIQSHTLKYLFGPVYYFTPVGRKSIARNWLEVAIFLQHHTSMGVLLDILLDGDYQDLNLRQKIAMLQLMRESERD